MATTEFYTDLDLKGQQIKNARVEVYETAPTTATKPGMFAYYNGEFYISDETRAFVPLATKKSVTDLNASFTTLNTTVTAPTSGLVDKVAELEKQVGISGEGESLGTRVTKIETDLNTEKTGIKARLSATEIVATEAKNAAATNADNITTNANNISALQTAVGDVNSGLTKEVNTLKTTVGDASSGLVKGVADNKTNIAKNTADISSNTSKIGTLETTVAGHTTAIAGKVDKVEGKQLSTEDYTTAEKTKLAGIAEGAQANIIETVKVNGTALTPTSKAVDIDLSNYATVDDISKVYKAKGSVASVDDLPKTDNVVGDVYNVRAAFTVDGKVYPAGTNVVYVATGGDYSDGKWDVLAGLMDLSEYAKTATVNASLDLKADKSTTYTKTEVNDALGGKVDKINVSGGTYTKVTTNAQGQVTSGGSLVASDIPALDAAKITTGAFDVARIPALDAAKVTTGEFDLDRIPEIPSTKLGVVAEDKLALQVKTQAITAGTTSYTWAHGFGAAPYIVQVVKGGKVIIGLDVTYDATNIVVSANDALESGFTIKAIGPRA